MSFLGIDVIRLYQGIKHLKHLYNAGGEHIDTDMGTYCNTVISQWDRRTGGLCCKWVGGFHKMPLQVISPIECDLTLTMTYGLVLQSRERRCDKESLVFNTIVLYPVEKLVTSLSSPTQSIKTAV